MRFTRELPDNVNIIRGHSPNEIRIGDQIVRGSCLVSADQLILNWAPRVMTELRAEHFSAALTWQPEIILLGTGVRQIFPAREVTADLLSRGIGFEAMDTGAACRTYNVLVGENRRVVAGFIF